MIFHRLLIFLIFSHNLFAQEPDSTQSKGFFYNLVWDPFGIVRNSKKKSQIKNFENKAYKNSIYGQILGNTPYLGMGYSRILPIKDKLNIETGIGIGLTPHLLNSNSNSKVLSYSHHILLMKNIKPSVGLFTAYSGIFYNGFYFKEKIYNYIPAPQLGIRLGNNKPVSLNFNWTFYFVKEDFVRLKEPDIVLNGVTSKLLGSFGISLNYSF